MSGALDRDMTRSIVDENDVAHAFFLDRHGSYALVCGGAVSVIRGKHYEHYSTRWLTFDEMKTHCADRVPDCLYCIAEAACR